MWWKSWYNDFRGYHKRVIALVCMFSLKRCFVQLVSKGGIKINVSY